MVKKKRESPSAAYRDDSHAERVSDWLKKKARGAHLILFCYLQSESGCHRDRCDFTDMGLFYDCYSK